MNPNLSHYSERSLLDELYSRGYSFRDVQYKKVHAFVSSNAPIQLKLGDTLVDSNCVINGKSICVTNIQFDDLSLGVDTRLEVHISFPMSSVAVNA